MNKIFYGIILYEAIIIFIAKAVRETCLYRPGAVKDIK
jgi:hypothetical protein